MPVVIETEREFLERHGATKRHRLVYVGEREILLPDGAAVKLNGGQWSARYEPPTDRVQCLMRIRRYHEVRMERIRSDFDLLKRALPQDMESRPHLQWTWPERWYGPLPVRKDENGDMEPFGILDVLRRLKEMHAVEAEAIAEIDAELPTPQRQTRRDAERDAEASNAERYSKLVARVDAIEL